jgi:hypothetical protein
MWARYLEGPQSKQIEACLSSAVFRHLQTKVITNIHWKQSGFVITTKGGEAAFGDYDVVEYTAVYIPLGLRKHLNVCPHDLCLTYL